MAQSSPVPRLTDIIEAIEIISSEMAGMTLAAFEPDRYKARREGVYAHGEWQSIL